MPIEIHAVHHVQITVAKEDEEACRHFYGTILRLPVIPKPENLLRNRGAWYLLGEVELHLSIEANAENRASKRHVCYLVEDLNVAEKVFRHHEVEIIPDDQPILGMVRFYVRDPGGNRVEIAQRL